MTLPHDTDEVRNVSMEMIAPALLRDFPLQQQVFGHQSDAANNLLVADIRTQGVRDPIDVMPADNAAGLPEYTVLDGHRRRDVAIQLELESVPVRVRYDLVNASEEEVTRVFLNYNFVRRQLHPVDQANVLLNLYNAGSRGPLRFSYLRGVNVLARQLAGLLGKDQKTGGRYIRVAMLPEAIHEAVKRELLRLTLATKIFAIRDEDVREEIVDAVEEGLDTGEKLNDLVSEMLPNRAQVSPRRLRPDLDKMLTAVEEFEGHHSSQIDGRIHSGWRTDFLDRVVNCRAMLDRIVAQLDTIDSANVSVPDDDIDLDIDPFADQIDMLEDDDD